MFITRQLVYNSRRYLLLTVTPSVWLSCWQFSGCDDQRSKKKSEFDLPFAAEIEILSLKTEVHGHLRIFVRRIARILTLAGERICQPKAAPAGFWRWLQDALWNSKSLGWSLAAYSGIGTLLWGFKDLISPTATASYHRAVCGFDLQKLFRTHEIFVQNSGNFVHLSRTPTVLPWKFHNKALVVSVYWPIQEVLAYQNQQPDALNQLHRTISYGWQGQRVSLTQ